MSYVVGAISVGTALYSGYKAVKASNAEKHDRAALAEERKNRPDYVIPDAFEENRNITGSIAGQGFGSAAKDFYTNLTQGGLTASISAAERSGAGINSLNELLDSYNKSNERLAAADSQMKQQNIGDFIEANSALAGQQLIKKFGIPNQRSQNDIASLNSSILRDQASADAAISDTTSSLASFATNFSESPMGQNITAAAQARADERNKERAARRAIAKANEDRRAEDVMSDDWIFRG